MSIKNYLWTFPFINFLFGYAFIQWFFHVKDVETPALVGKNINNILPLLSQLNLNIRLIDQKEEAALPEGTILYQTPKSGAMIKQHQSIFIVTSKKIPTKQAPQCVGLSASQITHQCSQSHFQSKIYYLPHQYPEGICFAQSPSSDEPIENNRLIFYISCGNNKPIIWPNLLGSSLSSATEFLQSHHIDPYVIYDTIRSNASHDDYLIIDQRPLPGTLLTLDDKKPISVQLRVR